MGIVVGLVQHSWMTSDQLLIDLEKTRIFIYCFFLQREAGITQCVPGISFPFKNSLQIIFAGLGYVKTLRFPVFKF